MGQGDKQGTRQLKVIGTLPKRGADEYSLDVREFELVDGYM